MDICNFITFLRKKDLASASVTLYIAALEKFYAMNDIVLNWKRIRSFMAEHEDVVEDRPYTHVEIQRLLEKAAPRNRAIVLFMASAGLRVGAVPPLRLRDLEPIDKYNIYKVTVYAKSKKFRYFTFCTPECRAAIDQYLEWRRRFGERFNNDTILFRREYNATGERVPYPRPIGRTAIVRFIKNLLLQTGLRTVPLETEKHKRYDIMMTHGFRKFFQTTCITNGMSPLYSEFLMGHYSGGLAIESYIKPTEQDLLEGNDKMMGYVGIIDALTINEENRLRREVKTLRIEKSKMEQVLERINKLENKILNQQ